MKTAALLIHGARESLARRQVTENAMLSLAPSFMDAASDLAIDIASPDGRRVKEIAAAVRSCISSQTTAGLRGNVSGITEILDETSRSICMRQLPIVDRVHLIATIIQAVEEGLRDLLSEAITLQRARDGPSPSRGSTSGTRVKTTAKKPQVAEEIGLDSSTEIHNKTSFDVAVDRASESIAFASMTPDYDDV